MAVQFIISEYIERAMARAEYEKLEDGSFSGRISDCTGVVAFSPTLHECENELRSTLWESIPLGEDWLLVGFKLGHPLPVAMK